MIGLTNIAGQRRVLLPFILLLPLVASAGGESQSEKQIQEPDEFVKYCGPDPDAKKEGRLSEEAFTLSAAKEALETVRDIVNSAERPYDTEIWEHAIVRLNGWKLRRDISREQERKRSPTLHYLISDFCRLVKEESYLPEMN